MTKLQKIQIRLSEIRSELMSDEIDSDKRDTLVNELIEKESEHRAEIALAETPTDTPDDHPKRSVEIREYVESGYYDRPLTGAAKEFNAELGMSDAPGTVPIEVILPWMADEHRADALTPAPSSTTKNDQAIQQPVRAPSLLRDLNVATPRVPVGVQSFPRLTTDPTAALVAEGDAQEATAAAFSVSALSPIRLTGAIAWSVEDAASFRGMNDALQRALQSVVEEKMSDLALNGQVSPAVTGLLGGETVSDPSAAIAYGTAISQFAGHVDGIRARTMKDLRVFIGVDTFRTFVSTLNSTSGAILQDYLEQKLGSLNVESRIAAAASDIQQMLIVRGRATGAVMPLWSSRIIRDPYTLASKGQVRLQIITMTNFAEVNDGESYKLDKVKLA